MIYYDDINMMQVYNIYTNTETDLNREFIEIFNGVISLIAFNFIFLCNLI